MNLLDCKPDTKKCKERNESESLELDTECVRIRIDSCFVFFCPEWKPSAQWI